jgi:hypothetical protein
MFNDYAHAIPEAPNPSDPDALATVVKIGAQHGLEFLAPAPV